MAENVLGTLFSDIADAIRSKTGGTDTMKPAEFPERIGNIESSNVIEHIEIALDFSNGDQTETLPEGYSVSSATILKPDTLIAENIAEGVTIAGIVGTHKGGGSTEEIIFPLQNVSGFSLDSTYGVYVKNENPSPFVLESGKTYIVEWDGTTYECTAAPINDSSTGIGNRLLMGGADTGEPFGIGSLNNGDGLTYFALDAKTDHDIKVSKKVDGDSGTSGNAVCFSRGEIKWGGSDTTVSHGLGVIPDYVFCTIETRGVDESSGGIPCVLTGRSKKMMAALGETKNGTSVILTNASSMQAQNTIEDSKGGVSNSASMIANATDTSFMITAGSYWNIGVGMKVAWEAYGNLV